jgi:hypothetical protein
LVITQSALAEAEKEILENRSYTISKGMLSSRMTYDEISLGYKE